MNLHEAKSQRSRLLEDVEAGERIVIARARRRRLGQFAGEATIHADFDDLPRDIAAAFGRE